MDIIETNSTIVLQRVRRKLFSCGNLIIIILVLLFGTSIIINNVKINNDLYLMVLYVIFILSSLIGIYLINELINYSGIISINNNRNTEEIIIFRNKYLYPKSCNQVINFNEIKEIIVGKYSDDIALLLKNEKFIYIDRDRNKNIVIKKIIEYVNKPVVEKEFPDISIGIGA